MNHLAATTNITKQPKISQRQSDNIEVLGDIYHANVNMAVWQRTLPAPVKQAVKQGLEEGLRLNITQEVAVADAFATLSHHYPLNQWSEALVADIAMVVDMFGCLFDTPKVGLRLRTLTSAMCPRFHFDRVPCRLITTYNGGGTQWLPNDQVMVENGRLEHQSTPGKAHVRRIDEGHIALLKGSQWPDNELTPLVHRSPIVSSAQPRILLTLDAM
ncbi:MAG: DUF1826 domain-containing protein [Alteromonadaceae bacterium]|nr:DUF1826 domain-containing protein [Alteromonadaceae bacterium]